MRKYVQEGLRSVARFAINKYKSLNFRPHIITKCSAGITCRFYIGDWVGEEWYDVDNPEWIEMEFVRDHLVEKGDVVIECGGHHGLSAILFSKWVGETGKVISFEPIPQSASILKKNIELNDISNVSVIDKCVGAARGTSPMSKSSCAYALSTKIGAIMIDMVPLDQYIDLHPTLLKIDVEGYEAEVLKGAKKILGTLPKLAIEIHADQMRRYGTSVAELLNLIPWEEYRCWVQWSDELVPEPVYGKPEISKRVHLYAVPLRKTPGK